MNRFIPGILLLLPLFGCQQTELSSVNEINSDPEAYMEKNVRLHGVHVKGNENIAFVSMDLRDYFVLEDESGRIKVWYNIASRRCAPRLGATVTVTGKIVASGQEEDRMFVARSISIDEQPPLAKNEVRLCELSLQEQAVYAEEGPEGLQAFWRDAGKPERILVFD